ncbi:MAG: SH3 domain-containing protein [Clostridiaceae bacterium]|jgi:uncharacterized protein YgiM (DUF1202 family)|nr:SH3 domain-containing protein [Clostridiaceae bacterium]
MKARRRLDRVLLLVAAALVFTLAAVLIVKAFEEKTRKSGLLSVNFDETATPAETSELEVHNKSEEALLEVDHLGRDLPELIDIYPAPTVAPMPVSEPAVETTGGELPTGTEDSADDIFTTTAITLQLSDYEIFLNPPSGSYDVDLTLYVSAVGGVNLRSDASTDSLAKQVIDYGSSVHVIRVEGAWVEVKLSGGERGYLAREYLQAIRPPVLESSATSQPVTSPTQPPIQNQPTAAPTVTQPPATVAPSSGNFLLGIANPDPNYAGRPVQVEDRAVLEGLVMGEFGSDYTGAVLVAQAIRDSMTFSGVYSTAKIAQIWGYHANVTNYINETTKRAVAFVFDEGGSAVQHSIYYFYAAHRVNSSWHESQKFVVEYGGCRFFSR